MNEHVEFLLENEQINTSFGNGERAAKFRAAANAFEELEQRIDSKDGIIECQRKHDIKLQAAFDLLQQCESRSAVAQEADKPDDPPLGWTDEADAELLKKETDQA